MTNSYLLLRMLRRLMKDEYTKTELIEQMKLSPNTVSRYIEALHREGFIRIVFWNRGKRGQSVPVFGYNPDGKPDAVKVSFAQPNEVIQKRYYDKQKAIAINNIFAGRSMDG